jgi:hypothetical protein
MDKQMIIFIGLLAILFVGVFVLFAQNAGLRNDNKNLANAFFTNQANLVEICKIDYNAFVLEQSKQYYSDLNRLIIDRNYRVG